MKQNKTETVKVAIRVRPMNSKEKKEGNQICVDVDKQENTISVNKQDNNDNKTFNFDYVYAPGSQQRDIYDEVAFPLVESVFQGYNATIFAYGQTGCGKTYTMIGDFDNSSERGITPNAFSHIFGYINSGSGGGSNKKFLVRCSYLEIYNEEIRDLLSKDCTKKLEMREDPKSGIFIKDLNIIQVKNTTEIENFLNLGSKNKHMGETKMNQDSSRSHCIFTVYMEIGENMDDDKNKKIKAGKLNLVDLAGSERQSKTNATGERLNEAKKINLSLSALSNVINSLVEKKSHVPFRDSKLTRLLQDSLGGNTKTLMIAAISPSSYNFEETVTTLRYAARANSIKNTPIVNQDPKDALLKQYEEEIKRLREQCSIGGAPQIIIKEEKVDNDELIKLQSEKNRINEEKLEMEKYLKEKDEMLQNNNIEKEKLMQKLKDMEKDLEKKLISGGGDDEQEKKKFKEYRENQIKRREGYTKKKKLIEEKKQEEEEALKDTNKSYANSQDEIRDKSKVITILKNKLKCLESEVRDLRYENDRDKDEMIDTIKELTKENKLFAGMLRMILSDNEIKRITEMSVWKDVNEDWRIKPFSIKEKKLNFPSINPHQINGFVEGEISNRDLIINGENDSGDLKESCGATRTNKFMSTNQRNDKKREKTLPPTQHNKLSLNNSYLKNIKQDENSDYNLQSVGVPHEKTKSVKTLHMLNPMNAIKNALQLQNSSNNQIMIQRIESKKLEELMFLTKNTNGSSPKLLSKGRKLEPITALSLNSNNNNNNSNNNNSNNSNNGFNDRESGNNASKSNFFNSNNNNNKMEVSIKATVCFSNNPDEGNQRNKKIEFNPNFNVNNPNIMNININNNNNNNNINNKKDKGKLEKIPELKEKLNTEREEEEEY